MVDDRPAAACLASTRHAGFLVLDAGPAQVRALAVRANQRRYTAQAAASVPCSALRNGIVVDLPAARRQFGAVLDQVAAHAALSSRRVLASVHGTHLHCARTSGSLRLRVPALVRETHIERLMQTAADIGLPADHEVLHVLPRQFRVDGVLTPRPPLGMRARQLGVEASVVTVSRLALDNLERVVRDTGYVLVDVVAAPLVVARVALRAEEIMRGVLLVDIGGEAVRAALYREGSLRALAYLGAGASHVTRDLSYAFRLSPQEAETLKCRYGVARVADADPDLHLECGGSGGWRVGQVAVAQVIEPRMRELLALVQSAIERQETLRPDDQLVLLGGGVCLAGVAALAESVFGLRSRTARVPIQIAGDDGSQTASVSEAAWGLVTYAERCGLAMTPPAGSRWGMAWRGMQQMVGTGVTWLGSGRRPHAADVDRREMRGRTLQ